MDVIKSMRVLNPVYKYQYSMCNNKTKKKNKYKNRIRKNQYFQLLEKSKSKHRKSNAIYF